MGNISALEQDIQITENRYKDKKKALEGRNQVQQTQIDLLREQNTELQKQLDFEKNMRKKLEDEKAELRIQISELEASKKSDKKKWQKCHDALQKCKIIMAENKRKRENPDQGKKPKKLKRVV